MSRAQEIEEAYREGFDEGSMQQNQYEWVVKAYLRVNAGRGPRPS